MSHTFKALLMQGVTSLAALFFSFELSAQNSTFPELEGTWILDSVQVKEVMPDTIAEKTLPGNDIDFYGNWMWQLTLAPNGVLSYTDSKMQNTLSASYTIKDRKGNMATLIIEVTGGYNIKIQMLSENSMIAVYSYKTMNNKMQDIEVFWNMYYHKSN